MKIDVPPAGENEYEVVANLVRFYIYDLSEHMGWPCPETGLFGGVDDLPNYWGRAPEGKEGHWPDEWVGYPFLIRADGELAGLCLVQRREDGPPPLYEMGEFFVLRRFRRRGVGRHVIRDMFDRFPGRWRVRVLVGNKPAEAFWRGVIAEYTRGRFETAECLSGSGRFPSTAYTFFSGRRSEG